MKFKNTIYIITFVLLITSCKKDETVVVEPPRDLSDIQLEDDVKIQEFLEAYFYNYEEFENPPVGFDYKIVLDSIKGENIDKKPLSEFVKDTLISISSNEVGIEGDAEVMQKLYYLIARKGKGGSPTVADSVYVRYNGRLLNETVFQPQTSYNWTLLSNPTASLIRGFKIGISKLNAALNINLNSDGTLDINDSGIGLVIFPSSLGYYDIARTTIPEYSPLIFEFELAAYVENTDYDNDGIPSILEDLNNNGILNDDNTDLEDERKVGFNFFANYLDPDDDNDGTPTKEEINLDTEGKFLSFKDTDGDGIWDHLDADTK